MRRAEQLARRRAELVARSARLRNTLALEGVRISGQLGFIDKGFSLARSLTRQPLLLAGSAALLMYLRPLRAMKWAARGAMLFAVARKLFGIVEKSTADREEPPTFV
jgi:hypothetical protein